LTDLYHTDYSKCPPVARMHVLRHLRRWSLAS